MKKQINLKKKNSLILYLNLYNKLQHHKNNSRYKMKKRFLKKKSQKKRNLKFLKKKFKNLLKKKKKLKNRVLKSKKKNLNLKCLQHKKFKRIFKN